jgi:hypothetical protein
MRHGGRNRRREHARGFLLQQRDLVILSMLISEGLVAQW